MDALAGRPTARQALAAALALAAAGCAPGAPAPPSAQPARPAFKQVCEPVRLGLPPGFVEHERRLTGLSPTVLGREVVYRGGDQRVVRVVVGGWLDDTIEAYDDLEHVETRRLGERQVDAFEGTMLGEPLAVAAWQEGDEPLCARRVVIGFGLEAGDVWALLEP